MLQINNDQALASGGSNFKNQFDDAGIMLRGLVAALRRQLKLIIMTVIIFLLVGVAYIIVAPKKFTSESSILVDLRRPNMFSQQGFQLQTIDTGAIDSQAELLRSERIALRVINKLNLLENPERIRGFSYLGAIKDSMAEMLGFEKEPETRHALQRSVLEAFMRSTKVERQGQTYVITVSYSATDRDLAAQIAQALSEAYLTDQLEAKLEATRLANVWLEERLVSLRAELLRAETAVQTYKAEHNIVDAAGTMVFERELNEINSQLTAARGIMAETKARFERTQEVLDSRDIAATVNDAVNSPAVQRLRGMYADIARREADIRRRLGPQHLAVAQARQEMQEIERQIVTELARIAEGYRSEYEIARAKVEGLEATSKETTQRAQQMNAKRVKLAELERNLFASRNLYDNFVSRFKTTAQDESYPISEARLVSEAAPSRFPSQPKTLLVMVFAGAAGVIAGVGVGLMRERLDDVVRSGEVLEAVTATEMLGVVPTFGDDLAKQKLTRHTLAGSRKNPTAPAQKGERLLPHDIGFLRYAVDYPFSRVAETMRSIKLALQFGRVSADDRVIGIVSALPGEGKSTVVMNFAQHLASTGSRTLLIDCDLRNPSLTRQVTGRSSGGLLDVLYRSGSLDSLAFIDPVTGLHFLSTGARSAVAQTDELLGSERMRELIASLKTAYDYVVLDLPPIVPTVDARAIASSVDAFVYVVEWGKTPRQVIQQALKGSEQITSKLVGSVLNKVRHDSLRLYDSYAALTYGQDYGSTPTPTRGKAEAA